MRRLALVPLALLAVLGLLPGCAGQRLRGEVDQLGGVIAGARASGAERCAPVQLAMAEAHREFATVELDEGDYYRARAELALASDSARAAVRQSPRERCTAVAPRDRDHDGVADASDACPTRAEDRDGVDDADGCPEEDDDHDGLVGAADRCPSQPEDRDGFTDDDGCPDLDNDQDRLPDRVDQCPDVAEDADGRNDDDGCPDCDDDGDQVPECGGTAAQPADRCPGQPGRPEDGCPYAGLVVTDQRIELRQPIEFAAGRARVLPASSALVAELARALNENPTLTIRIEAHTDSQGRARANLRLSRARAAALRRLLIRRGIDRRRMVSVGYGEERPTAENTTAEGRAENRRVEIVITGR